MKRKIVTSLIFAGMLLAGSMGITDLIRLDEHAFLCAGSCSAVHDSSFGSLAGIPLGFVGMAALLFLQLLLNRKKDQIATCIAGAMCGAELYLTLLQIVHIERICTWCLAFFALLLTIFVLLLNRESFLQPVTTLGFCFLLAHFCFFPLGVELSPDLMEAKISGQTDIEIFASPSCDNCENAIDNLKQICSASNTNLLIRPVGLNSKDKEKSIKWVCDTLFEQGSPGAIHLSEKLVWKNEKTLKQLNNGKLATPIIIINNQTYRGWNEQIREKILSTLGTGGKLVTPVDLIETATAHAHALTSKASDGCSGEPFLCTEHR